MSVRPIMVSANEAWNLVNFRASLIAALIARGVPVIAVAPYEEASVARLVAMGCRFLPIDIDQAGVRPLRDLVTIRDYLRILRAHRPAALISWTIKPNLYGGIAAAIAGIPALPNVSGLGTAFLQPGIVNRIVRVLYRAAFARARTVFFQNRYDRDLFIADGLVRSDQARIIPGSGLDLTHFAPPRGGRRNPGLFLMLARIIGDKGVREYVAAARAVRQRFPQTKFVLMGAANVANRTAISSEELAGWVAEGVIEYRPPSDDVRPAIAECDVVVLPSYREGMARVLLEACAMARPIVTTDVPGCADLVTDGDNGFLCKARDASSLAAAIMRAAAINDDEWSRMANAGRQRVEKYFSHDAVISAYMESLKNLENWPGR